MATHTTSSKHKKQYRIRNWKEHNEVLVNRGNLMFWVNKDVLEHWENTEKTGKRGKPKVYGDIAIRSFLTAQALFHQPLRQTEGLLNSIFRLARLSLKAPDYSTVSKRTETLSPVLAHRAKTKRITDVVIDATGVKIYGEGEWKVRRHGKSKRRTWRKVHIALDPDTGDIIVTKATLNDVHDSEVVPELLAGTPDSIHAVYMDGAGDTRDCYQAIADKRAAAVIPPRTGARIWQHGNTAAPPHQRDENLRKIRAIGLRRRKEESGYHRRSLAETAFFRFKTVFGDKIPARTFPRQAAQILIRCRMLNQMLTLGMPDSYVVA